MKKITLHFILIFTTILCISCDNSDDNDIPLVASLDEWVEVSDASTPDDLLLVTVSKSGQVFTVGNNTGTTNTIGNMGLDFNESYLAMQTVIATENTIYAVEYLFDEAQTNNLLIHDIASNTTQRIPLTFPSNIEGDQPRVLALVWDNTSNLIALVDEDFYPAGSTRHLVNISLQDYSVSEIGVTYDGDIVTSMKKVANNIYISTWNEGLIEIDLATNTLNTLSNINGTRLATISDTQLAFMEVYGLAIRGVRPSIIDTNTQTVTPNFATASIQVNDILGGTVFANQTYLNLVITPDVNFGILKTDFNSDKSILVPITFTDYIGEMVMVNAIPVN